MAASVASAIATRHFGRKAVAALRRTGVTIMGLQALPGRSGTYLDSETGYLIADNGTGRVWTYAETAAAIRAAG